MIFSNKSVTWHKPYTYCDVFKVNVNPQQKECLFVNHHKIRERCGLYPPLFLNSMNYPFLLSTSNHNHLSFFIAKITNKTHWRLSILIQKSSVSDLSWPFFSFFFRSSPAVKLYIYTSSCVLADSADPMTKATTFYIHVRSP